MIGSEGGTSKEEEEKQAVSDNNLKERQVLYLEREN